jgi:hypothetical protein
VRQLALLPCTQSVQISISMERCCSSAAACALLAFCFGTGSVLGCNLACCTALCAAWRLHVSAGLVLVAVGLYGVTYIHSWSSMWAQAHYDSSWNSEAQHSTAAAVHIPEVRSVYVSLAAAVVAAVYM